MKEPGQRGAQVGLPEGDAWSFGQAGLEPRYVLHCLVLGLLGGIVSQFGDLTASVYKRRMGIKDYGNLIPGHGGILDRFDSVLYTAPLVYYYIVLLLN